MEEFILPDGIETEQVAISKYIRHRINEYKEFLPEATTELEVLEYMISTVQNLE